jgi:hypothetical protein
MTCFHGVLNVISTSTYLELLNEYHTIAQNLNVVNLQQKLHESFNVVPVSKLAEVSEFINS